MNSWARFKGTQGQQSFHDNKLIVGTLLVVNLTGEAAL